MVATTLREPRPGSGGAKKADFLRPGTTVTLIALAPEAGLDAGAALHLPNCGNVHAAQLKQLSAVEFSCGSKRAALIVVALARKHAAAL